jgi:TPR repeat protein
MLRAVLLAAALLLAGRAMAADQPIYGPEEAWVQPISIPQAAAPGDGSPVQFLLVESQTNFLSSGDAYYQRRVMKILSPEGLGLSGQISAIWDPATEVLTIHHLHVIRAGTVTDVLANGQKFLVLRRENNLELAMLDGRLTATIQPEDLEVGDIVDFAYTLTRRDPAMGGHSTHFEDLAYSGTIGRFYSRALWPASKPIRWNRTAGMDVPTVRQTSAGTEAVVDMANTTAPKQPTDAPVRFQQLGLLEYGDFHDWGEVSSLLAPLYQKAETLRPDSPLRAEIAKIARAGSDPKLRAMAALRLVENETRYVYLGLNDGGIVPAVADETWSRRFGDCKGKSVLLAALLRGLGLDAEVALVSVQNGDGLDQHLPVPDWFDHAIVRLRIGTKTYWLDGARLGDLALDDLTVPNYHWALPIQAAGGALVPLDVPVPTVPLIETRIRIDASKGPDLPAPAQLAWLYRGEQAVSLRVTLTSMARSDFDRDIRQMMVKTYPWLTAEKIDVVEEDAANQMQVTVAGTTKMDWETDTNGSRFYHVRGTGMGTDIAFKRDPGPNADAPFIVPYPIFNRFEEDIILPATARFMLIGTDVGVRIAGRELTRKSRIDKGVLQVETSLRTIAQEFPAAEAAAAGAALQALPQADVAVEYALPTVASSLVAAPASTDLEGDRKAAEKGDPAAQERLGRAYETGAGLPLDFGQATAWFSRAADQGSAEAQVQMGGLLMAKPGKKDVAGAVAWYRRAAVRGNAAGEEKLGYAFLLGAGVPKDPKQAVSWFTKASDQGDADSALGLYWAYRKGVPPMLPADQAEALKWLRLAAGRNLATAQNILGYRLWMGLDMPADYAEAVVWLGKAAAQGDVQAENNLGLIYWSGQGVPRNPTTALDWFRKSAAQGHGNAMLNLGDSYGRGFGGVPRDYDQALLWYRQAADHGVALADKHIGEIYLYGLGVPRIYAQALSWFQKGAAQQDAGSEFYLGLLYRAGLGVQKDRAQSMDWFLKAASDALQTGGYELGIAYRDGNGVSQDFVRARLLLQREAIVGNAAAEYALGLMYWNGQGTRQDYVQAVSWLQKAADQGHIKAEASLGIAYEHGYGGHQDNAQAAAWYRKAADQGDANGEVSLGVFYYQGRGVPRDLTQAFALFQKSAAQGNVDAERCLGLSYERGDGVAADPVQAKAWLSKAAAGGDTYAIQHLAVLASKG